MQHITYKKILIPHDGSRLASAALPHALLLAKSLHAYVILLHVTIGIGTEVAVIPAGEVAPPMTVVVDEKALQTVRRIALKELQKIKTEYEKNGLKNVSFLIKSGKANHVIVDTAKQEHCDIIVMSTHGRSGFGRALLGSTADYVIHYAPCPIFLIHPKKYSRG